LLAKAGGWVGYDRAEAGGGVGNRKMKIIRKKLGKYLVISKIFRNFATKLQN
jgi:hypothetical protein